MFYHVAKPIPQEPALEPQRALLLIPEPVSRLHFFVNNTGLISQDESKSAINIGSADKRYRTNGNVYSNPASPAVARFLQLSKTAWTIQQIDALFAKGTVDSADSVHDKTTYELNSVSIHGLFNSRIMKVRNTKKGNIHD